MDHHASSRSVERPPVEAGPQQHAPHEIHVLVQLWHLGQAIENRLLLIITIIYIVETPVLYLLQHPGQHKVYCELNLAAVVEERLSIARVCRGVCQQRFQDPLRGWQPPPAQHEFNGTYGLHPPEREALVHMCARDGERDVFPPADAIIHFIDGQRHAVLKPRHLVLILIDHTLGGDLQALEHAASHPPLHHRGSVHVGEQRQPLLDASIELLAPQQMVLHHPIDPRELDLGVRHRAA
mmetsp:Transcript_19664/g.49284  ORF Transcript_19664/g.49284 Transcript_19664/m.49284 type:complete len:238 (+) Transcript_19664:250-963(+)